LLAQQFDPKELRYQTGANALTQLGLGLLSPDPRAPNAWQSGLSRGFAGAAQGIQDTQDRFYQRGMQNVQLNELQRTYNQRDQAKAEVDKLLPTLPPELQQAFGGFARTYPDEFLKTFADARLKAQYAGTKEFGLNPVWTQGADGKYHLYQPDNRGGSPREMDFGGNAPVPGTKYLDTGTGYTPMPTKGVATPGATGEVVPKDLVGAENQKSYGEAVGKARANLPNAENAAAIMLSTIDSLKTDPYLPNMVGPVAGRMPNVTGEAARVQGKMDQIGGQSFLQAYQFLRGGGAITDVEGAKATAAISRLQTTQDINDYNQALDELRGITTRAIERARAFAAGQLPGDTGQAPPQNTGTGNVIKYDAQGNRVQ
jgi:hypothetical protein